MDWSIPLPLVWESLSTLGKMAVGDVDNGVRVADVSGDGLPDLVYGLKQDGKLEPPVTFVANPGRTDLLVKYVNAIGGKRTFAYGQASGLGLPAGRMPSIRTVATLLREDGGLSDPATASSYEYRGGMSVRVLDPDTGRPAPDFRGFQSFHEKRADDTRHERDYYQDEGKRGRLAFEVQGDSDGQVYSSYLADYSSAEDAEGVYRTLLTLERAYKFHQNEETQNVLKRTEYQDHDAFGNPRLVREFGYGGAVERQSRITYVSNTTSAYIILPYKTERLAANGSLLATEELCYDDACGSVSDRGALTTRRHTDHRLSAYVLASGSATVETRTQYDPYGNVAVETNGRGFATRFTWEGNGFLFPGTETRDNPGGPTLLRKMVFDLAHGVLREYVGWNTDRTTYDYDGLGRLKSIQYPSEASPGTHVTFHLDARPAYMEVQDALDAGRTQIRREYFDGLGRLKAKVVGGGTTWSVSDLTQYDGVGHRVRVYQPFSSSVPSFVSDGPANLVTSYEYEDDKVWRTTFPGGAVAANTYEADGVLYMDENGIFTSRKYDAFGQLTQVTTDVYGSGSTHGTSRYFYDELGGLRVTLDPSDLKTFLFYDARGLLRGVRPPEGTQQLRNGFKIWNDYDEQGNLTYRWSHLDVSRATFDALDRQTHLHVSRDGGTSFFGESTRVYDQGPNGEPRENGIGRLNRVIGYGPPQTWSDLTYNTRGRVTAETFFFQELDAALNGVSIRYGLDRHGDVMSLADPLGRTLVYTRDVFGRLTGEGQAAVTLTGVTPEIELIEDVDHDALGQVTGILYGHGALDTFLYDGRGRMTDIVGSGPLEIKYAHDLAGNLLSETHLDRPYTVSYGYDALARTIWAKEERQNRFSLGYAHDGSGNLLSITGTGAPNVGYSYVPETNQLESVSVSDRSFALKYDPHGNVTSFTDIDLDRSVRQFGYDALGRLRSYHAEASASWRNPRSSGSVVYDGHDRKVQRTLAVGKEIYFYTVDGKVLSTVKNGKWTTYLLADAKRLAAIDDLSQVSYIHTDRLASARALTTPAAQGYSVAWRGDYLPFGAELDAQAGGDDFKFTGQESEPSLGMYDYGARYYDPVLGRFLQIDRFLGDTSDPRTLNRYSYALGNPTKYTDPDGNCPVCLVVVAAILWDAVDSYLNAPTPTDVEQGNLYEPKSNTEFAAEQVAGAGAAFVATKIVAKAAPLVKNAVQAAAQRTTKAIKTTREAAKQSTSAGAVAARGKVERGATLYRSGKTGDSGAAEGQYWALEHPNTPGYASRYGLPTEGHNFVEMALKPGAHFVTREARGAGINAAGGGGIEVVVEKAGVVLESFSLGPVR